MNNNYELIKFEDGQFSLDVNVSPSEDTVWLSSNEMAYMFERNIKPYKTILIIFFSKQA